MKYNGIELTPITTPQIFDPPKEMLVWDSGSNELRIEKVWGIAPASSNSDYLIHCVDGVYYDNCAEIPQQKPKRATNIQLMEWLAKGNGICNHLDNCGYFHSYVVGNEEELLNYVDDKLLIRPFGTTEWVEPTLENMGMVNHEQEKEEE